MNKRTIALSLVVLILQAACVNTPGHGLLPTSAEQPPPPAERTLSAEAIGESATVYEVGFLEPGRTPARPIPIGEHRFRRTLQRLARSVHLKSSAREAARELMWTGLEEEWLAEAYRGQVLTLVPLNPRASLVPEADAALSAKYLSWCETRGGGDCLGLLEDGPYLRTDDRRTLALALALGSVLDETHAALAHELNPRALMSLVLWTVGFYCMAWVVPEPTLKAVAATMTVVLVAWLGMETVWGLMDGWAAMAHAASEATTFEELRAAGEQYAKVLGPDAARVLVLAAGAVMGRTLGEVAARVRSLPGFAQAEVQWKMQGGTSALEQAQSAENVAVQEGALAMAVVAVEAVAVSPQGPMAAVMLRKGAGGGAGGAWGGRGARTVLRHRGGNQQVELSNGQRWHLPRGKSLRDIPAQDKVGDQLQEAVTRAASEWGPGELSINEQRAIDKALGQGKYWLARLLEREARGRFVQARVRQLFGNSYDFSLNSGVDIIDPATGCAYEILSGTESNLARHGRRMAGGFFRMLTF